RTERADVRMRAPRFRVQITTEKEGVQTGAGQLLAGCRSGSWVGPLALGINVLDGTTAIAVSTGALTGSGTILSLWYDQDNLVLLPLTSGALCGERMGEQRREEPERPPSERRLLPKLHVPDAFFGADEVDQQPARSHGADGVGKRLEALPEVDVHWEAAGDDN